MGFLSPLGTPYLAGAAAHLFPLAMGTESSGHVLTEILTDRKGFLRPEETVPFGKSLRIFDHSLLAKGTAG